MNGFSLGRCSFCWQRGVASPSCVSWLSCAWCVHVMSLTCARTSVVRLMSAKKVTLRYFSSLKVSPSNSIFKLNSTLELKNNRFEKNRAEAPLRDPDVGLNLQPLNHHLNRSRGIYSEVLTDWILKSVRRTRVTRRRLHCGEGPQDNHTFSKYMFFWKYEISTQ